MLLSFMFFTFMQYLPMLVSLKLSYTFALPGIMPLIIGWYYIEKYNNERSTKNYWFSILKGMGLLVVMEYIFQHMLSFGIWSLIGAGPAILGCVFSVSVFLVFQKNLFGQYDGILNKGSGLRYKALFYNFLLYFSFFAFSFVIHAQQLVSVSSSALLSQILVNMFMPAVVTMMAMHVVMRLAILCRGDGGLREPEDFFRAFGSSFALEEGSAAAGELVVAIMVLTVIFSELSCIHEGAERAFSVILSGFFAFGISYLFSSFSALSWWLLAPILLWNRMSTGWFPILADQYEPTRSVDYFVDQKWPEKSHPEQQESEPSPLRESAFSM